MRLGFVLAALLSVLATSGATAFDRNPIASGDVVYGDILQPYTLDEFPLPAVYGSMLSLTVNGAAPRAIKPTLGVYDDNYATVAMIGTSPTSAKSAGGLATGVYRLIVGGVGASVGAYRLKASLKPTTKFTFGGGKGAANPQLQFGAFAGYDATISVQWKGASPVTLTSVVGPGAAPVIGAGTPKTSKNSFSQSGFHAALPGDYLATLAVPADAVRWSATVTLSGKMPAGVTRDFRSTGAPGRPTVAFPTFGRFPVVIVVGEVGGPNGCLLSSAGSSPDGAFLDGGAGSGGCASSIADANDPPTKYELGCNDGFLAEVESVERYSDGPWAGKLKSFVAPTLLSPQGSGSATLTDFTYDAAGRPTGWTETRHFDASGRDHRLVVSNAEYFANGICKGFRVAESLLVGGVPETPFVADYAPFN